MESTMSFFNDIGKNISSKTKEISQKAKVMSESSSLNNIIKGEECKIDFQYKIIGKLYFEKYGENADEEFMEAINTIKASMEKIQHTQDEIKRIKSMFNCPNCGAPFKNDAAFCAKCGAKLPEKKTKSEPQVPEGAQKCGKCGNILTKEALFCNVCGNKLEPESENNTSPEATVADILTSDRKEVNNQPEVEAAVNNYIPNECFAPSSTVSLEKTETENVQEAENNQDSENVQAAENNQDSENVQASENNQEAVEKTKKICPKCQNEMLDEDVFCNVCGNKFE